MFMPPFGLNLFAAHALFKTPLPELYRGVLPFLCIYLAMLMLITYVPAITLAPLALLAVTAPHLASMAVVDRSGNLVHRHLVGDTAQDGAAPPA